MSQGMRSGELTRYVTVQARTTTQDASGAQQATWNPLKNVYAGIRALSGRELAAAQSVYTDVSHVITVRYDAALWVDPKIAAGLRVVYTPEPVISPGTLRIFDIRGVLNEDESNRQIQLAADEGLTKG